MQVGLMAPQGWKGEYDGWDAAEAWARTVDLARQAEALGFESLWVFDHFHTVPQPTDEITFEGFSVLTALAMATSRVRLGHMVVCTGFRNPALTAKLSSTIDVISGGRFELGIGAGWKEEEWRAYGYGFPTLGERMGALGDHLEIISRMFGPGRAAYEGTYAHVRGAINVPKGVQSRIPIIVGGNGERRTAGYAITYARRVELRLPRGRRDRRAHGERPRTMRQRGPRSGHAAVLALYPRRSRAPRRIGADRLRGRDGRDRARPDRVLSRRAGIRPSMRRRRSPRTAGPPA